MSNVVPFGGTPNECAYAVTSQILYVVAISKLERLVLSAPLGTLPRLLDVIRTTWPDTPSLLPSTYCWDACQIFNNVGGTSRSTEVCVASLEVTEENNFLTASPKQ